MRDPGLSLLFVGMGALLFAGAAGCEDDYPPLPASPPAETQPVLSRPPAEAGLVLEAPHGGSLLPISDGLGSVEWAVASGNLYYLDLHAQPLEGVAEAALYVSTSHGPQRVELRDCGDAQYPGACSTASGQWLRDPETTGLLRFTLNGEGYRVHLTGSETSSRPADIASPAAARRAIP